MFDEQKCLQVHDIRRQFDIFIGGAPGLRLCIHDRDFILGNNISDNIVDSVLASKKIVMLFSLNSARDQWCQFELNFCLRHVMENDDTLVVLCVDDIPSRDLTRAMMAVMKTTAFLMWDDDQDAQASFWGRLQIALHEIIPVNP
nr:hypothetical protein BaRGS_022665 [Batillaria attramentaria]